MNHTFQFHTSHSHQLLNNNAHLSNGKTIEVDNTDAEGRLALADGLCYSSTFKPKHLIDVATLTGACVVALGHQLTGCYASTNEMWKMLEKAGINTKDYVCNEQHTCVFFLKMIMHV